MGSIEYFSDGAGLPWLFLGVAALLAGLGTAIHFSRLRPYLGNILLPASLVVLSLVFWVFTYTFPEEEAGAAVLPRLYIALILLLSGIILLQIFRGREKTVARLEKRGLLALVIAMLAGYLLVIPLAGYFLSTFLFIALMLHLLSYKRKVLIWLISGGWVVFSYLLFYKLLYIQLPLGVFEGLF